MTDLQNQLIGYLESAVANANKADARVACCRCIEEFVLRNGRWFETQPLPASYRRGTPRECFHNATNLITDHGELRYVEGYASSGAPHHHAWCIDALERVVDSTVPHPGNSAYFGVCFPTTFVLLYVLRAEHSGVLDNDACRNILLSRPFDPEALE